MSRRRPLPGRLPLRRGLGAPRRRADWSLRWRAATLVVGLDRHARRPPRAQAAARRRLGCRRRRVHQPRAGHQRADRRRGLGRGRGHGAHRSGSRARLHRRHRQGVRRRNRNGLQDEGERGIPGVRLATARGLLATTDQFGRFHITCAVTPHEGRGSNFVLKLDNRTLPTGFRVSTEALQIIARRAVKRSSSASARPSTGDRSRHRRCGVRRRKPWICGRSGGHA